MCGISGLVCQPRADAGQFRADLARAVEVQHHRGPDGNGILIEGCVGLAHNRLSILDLSELGSQPMVSRSGRTSIAYNGEIYNFRDIAEKLNLTLQSGSDTEVLLEAYEVMGLKIFAELNGMFAFALHDRAKNQLFIVRDRLGIKPLYLAEDAGRTLFASEIKGLFAMAPSREKHLNTGALHEWAYFGNTLGESTLFQGVHQLEPGHALRIDLATGEKNERAYWTLTDAFTKARKDGGITDPEDAASRIRTALENSVARHMVADVPVGIFLSGGLDSSSITTYAARASGQRLTTYSAAFDHDTERSELALAREVATANDTDHHEIRIQGADTADVVMKMVENHDLPFSDAANIPLYLMCEKIGQSHKVILQGDGGDEMFAGYQRHLTLQRAQSYRTAFRMLKAGIGPFAKGRKMDRIARMVEALGASDDGKLMGLLLTVERESSAPTNVFAKGLQADISRADPFARYRKAADLFDGVPLAEKMLLTDKMIILPDVFFQKVDRSTMSASVEVRVPFLDNEIVDLVLGIPSGMLAEGGQQKGLLRRAMKDVLPKSILEGKKRGFGVPFGKWVMGPLLPLARDAIATAAKAHPDILDHAAIEKRIEQHLAGQADHGFMIWKVFNLSLWLTQQKVGL